MKPESRHYVRNVAVPWMLTAARFALAPALWSSIASGNAGIASCVLGAACATDLADGWLARRNGVVSRAGMYFDVSADFAVVVAGLAALNQAGVYPDWCTAVVLVMFLQFIATSLSGRMRYDPLGRYYGGFLYGLVGCSIAADGLASVHGGAVLAVVTTACIVSRVWTGIQSGLARTRHTRLPDRSEKAALVSRSS